MTFICFESFNQSQDSDGVFGELHLTGAFVFFGVVVLTNVKILNSTNRYDAMSLIFISLSIGSYFIVFYLLNLWVDSDLFGTFTELWKFSSYYFGTFFCASALIMVDTGMNMA